MFKSSQQREEQIQKLADYLGAIPDGEEVKWIRIEADTQIAMSEEGRELVRVALRRLKRQDYETVRGVGIRLSAPGSVLAILAAKTQRAMSAAKSADKSAQRLEARHGDAMTTDQRQKLTMFRATMGALRAIVGGRTTAPELPKGASK